MPKNAKGEPRLKVGWWVALSLKPDRSLVAEFRRIKNDHRKAIKNTVARSVTGPSVMRVYKPGTREALLPVLARIDIDRLARIRSQEAFTRWYNSQLRQVAAAIEHRNHGNNRILPGAKWGHATKILSIFVRDLVLRSNYFSRKDARRIALYLHAPIDGIVMSRLRKLGVPLRFSKIKEINSATKFYRVQQMLSVAAEEVGVPRVWFDDNWGDRQIGQFT